MARYRRWLGMWRVFRNARREVDEEVDAHVAMRTEALVRAGVPRERARAEAEARIGDREALYASARQRDRRLMRAEWWDGVRRDVGFAVRRALRSPGATALALLTFGLGIGLTTAGFAVVDGVLIRGLPYPASDRLVALQGVDSAGATIRSVAAATWREWREQGRTLESSGLYRDRVFTVSDGADAYRVSGEEVVGDFLGTIGTPLLLGRAFTEAEVESGALLAVVSERLWRSALGGRRDLPIELRLDGRSAQVVGVAAAGLGFPLDADIWVGDFPSITGNPEAHTWINWFAVGRLGEGMSEDRAAADLGRASAAIRASNPRAIYAYGVTVEPVRDFLVGDTDRDLLLLLGAVVFVLLIVCANLAGLGLARAATRRREMGVRRALGAGRGRIVRQLLIEHTLLALTGGLLGIGLALVVTRSVASRAASFLPRAGEIGMDWRVLGFAFAVSLVAGVAAGMLPALRASSADPGLALAGGRGTVRGGRGLPGAALVAVEVALALLLVTGSGLLARSFRNVVARDLGFRTEGVVTAAITLPEIAYDSPDRWIRYWESLMERLRRVSGVRDVGFANWTPASYAGRGFIEVSGRDPGRDVAGYRVVGGDYFDVLGVRVLAGRGFDERDVRGSERVALVNEAMAHRYWPDRDPIGERVKAVSMEFLEGREWLTVIGMVGDIRQFGYEADVEPEMYVIYRQVPTWADAMTMVVAGAPGASADALVAGVRDAVRAEDPGIAPDVGTLERQVDGLLGSRRFALGALAGFALLALVLGAIGVYGMLSFAVARRTAEIGIRAALGAGTGGILVLVMRSAFAIVGIGVAAGLVAAFWLTRLLGSMLVDVAPDDPVTFGAAILALGLVAAIAAFVPAWRATRVDPLDSLRTREG